MDTLHVKAYKEGGEMRVARYVLGVLALAALFAVGWALAATASVSLTAKGPEPTTVTVDWGDTVVFSNADTVDRQVTSPQAPFASGPIPPGGSFQYRFEGRAGRYTFVQTGTRPNTSGAVVVTASGEVTLVIGKAVAPYGTKVSVSGRSTYAGTPVVVQLRPYGGTGDWKDLLSLVASESGTYSSQITATQGGRLRARVAANQISSDFVDLALLPRVAASVRPRRARAGTRVLVTGRIVPADAASTVDLEVFPPDRKRWEREATKAVSKSGQVTFAFKAAKGRTKVRLSLSRSGLEPGFVPAASRSIVVIGTATRS